MSVAPTKDPILADHLAWLGYIQPEGLVVSAPALKDAQVVIDRASLPDLQRRFSEHLTSLPLSDSDSADTATGIADLPRFLTGFLGWPADLLVGWDATRPLPPELSISLPEFGETLAPTYAVTQPKPKEGASPWLLLVQSHPATVNLEKSSSAHERGWDASPVRKFERLLRETQVPIGILTNGVTLRLVYAPPKENSGALTFPVAAMAEIPGRLILGAFHLLLQSWTLFNAPSEARLPALLQRSRDYQASVSEKLAEQVLHALYELLRGFEAADAQAKSKILQNLAAQHPESIYGGLVTVLLRLVFVLFAEDRGLLPMGGLYVRHYSVRGLFERLRSDAERHPDTMDQRFGAWAQLLALFRLIHGGCDHPALKMPAREGHLFDPERYPFLEGRAQRNDPVAALPLVSDGVLHRILQNLCILDGERVSYRTLDVEEIGSVYQTIMGFGVEVVTGTAVAFKGKRKKGAVPAAPVLDLEALLREKPADRLKRLGEEADTKLTGDAEKRVKDAVTVDDLLAALEKRIDRQSTPSPVAKGGLVLQPNDERRRSGSHYTPRSFTEPIVRKTLEPVLARLVGPDLATVPADKSPTPKQILDLKVADIAVGSAAFLVEACRQLGDALVKAWRVHGGRPPLPPDETEELLAMRLVAQRCLYGVDRNPMAVDLAKLSLWLATLAKDHPFTFLDHNLRCGDSLVGLTQKQIEAFTWEEKTAGKQRILGQDFLEKRIKAATAYRRDILEGGDYVLPSLKAAKLKLADEALGEVRFAGDLIISAFFSADTDKARYQKLEELRERYVACHTSKTFDPTLKPREDVQRLRSGGKAVWPFHWEIEFPEVFERTNGGFDIIIGNPPFQGGTKISNALGQRYLYFLVAAYIGSTGNVDLVAFFLRRAAHLIRKHATFGLITTNSVTAGDSNLAGIQYLRAIGYYIPAPEPAKEWSGEGASVAIIQVHGAKSDIVVLTPILSPVSLSRNDGLCVRGSDVFGAGFILSEEEYSEWKFRKSHSVSLVKPYMTGDDFNATPTHSPSRFIINFGEMTIDEASKYTDAFERVERLVKPARQTVAQKDRRELWWIHATRAPAAYKFLSIEHRCIAISQIANHLAFSYVTDGNLFSNTLLLILENSYTTYANLQSRIHSEWVLRWAGSMGLAVRYTSTTCFETFPFAAISSHDNVVAEAGKAYWEFRKDLMVSRNEGLTKTYNRFNSPEETAPDILKLRELHAAMDRAALDAYGWTDIPTDCEFLLDYEDEEDDEATGKGRQRKKPWRYRWPDAIRDEVLARLLKLNAERAEQERLAGLAATPTAVKKTRAVKPKRAQETTPGLFDPEVLPSPVTDPVSRDGWRDRAFALPIASRHGELAADLYTRHWIHAALQLAPDGLPASQLINAYRLLLSADARKTAALSGDAEGKKWARAYRQKIELSDLLGSLLNRARDGEISIHNVNGEAHVRLNPNWKQSPSEWLFTDAEIVLRAQEDATLKLELLPFQNTQPAIETVLNELLRLAA